MEFDDTTNEPDTFDSDLNIVVEDELSDSEGEELLEKITGKTKTLGFNKKKREKKETTDAEVKYTEGDDLQDLFMVFLKDTQDIDAPEENNTVIPTGVDTLDTILGGGVRPGLVQLVGNPGTGKSALAGKILATARKQWGKNMLYAYCDSEEAMTQKRLSDLGVPNPKHPLNGMTVEKVFKIIEGMCTFKEKFPDQRHVPSLVIWDSIANSSVDAADEKTSPEQVLGKKAALLSFLLPKYVPKMNKYNICLLAINQLRDKIDMGLYGKPNELKYLGDKNLPGGKSVQFNSVQLIYLMQGTELTKQQSKTEKGKNKEYKLGFSSYNVTMKAVKNKYFTPGVNINMIFSHAKGYSNFFTNLELLIATKRVTATTVLKLVAHPNPSFRYTTAIETYKTDKEFRQAFDREVDDALKTEYLDRYANLGEDAIDIERIDEDDNDTE